MNTEKLAGFCSREEQLHEVSIQKAKTFFAVTLSSEKKEGRKERKAGTRTK